GIATIIEAREAKKHRGSSVVLSGKIRFSTAAPVRYAILAWTGTADAVTSDVVNSWTAASIIAGAFFLGSNITVLGVGSITPT
ncbi:hypothetical protein M3M33_15915, partial [Loigolactobacillus coryniformis]|uniref:hypothetical protein n=1 Tax=Loigolactobacillus coryniformis TaxID=1610 RepID=UPI00201B2AA0